MQTSGGFFDKILDGWERTDAENGIPYYMNHKTKRTQWDHPFYVKSFEELGEYGDIRYAAYRTAIKIRSLQRKYSMDLIDLKNINGVMSNFGYDGPKERVLEYREVQQIVKALFDSCRKPSSLTSTIDPNVKADLVLNMMLNMYDVNRSGCMRLSAVKIYLATLSTARLSEKYKYYFQQTSDDTNHIDRKRLSQLLHDLIQIPHVMNESSSFGGINVTSAVDSCFSQSWGTSAGITEDQFMRWLLQEPQTTVWLPTLHRLTAAEPVKHETKCSICKMNPITGLRYKCLKCFNYNLCQNCFFTGKVTKKHKVKHPTQEYCLNTSTKEDTKAFMRTVRNNFSKKHRHKNKARYLPICSSRPQYHSVTHDDERSTQSSYEASSVVSSSIKSDIKSVPAVISEAEVPLQQSVPEPPEQGFSMSERRELASIIQHLEQENNYLMQQLECMYDRSQASESPYSSQSRESVTDSEDSDWIEKDKMDAKQEVLEAHNAELNKQLKRLRSLLNKGEFPAESSSYTATSQRRPLSPLSVNTRLTHHTPDFTTDPKKQHSRKHADRFLHHREASDCSYGDGQSVPSSYYGAAVPRLHLSRLSNSDQYCATPVNSSSLVPPKPDFKTPESYGDPCSNNTSYFSKSKSEFQTPDSMNVDLTFGCIDNTMGRTHFTIASPEDSRDFRKEEEEMAHLIAQLDRDIMTDESKCELDKSDGAMGDMLKAAAGIGQAFSHMTSTHS